MGFGIEIERLAMDFRPFVARGLYQSGEAAADGIAFVIQGAEAKRAVEPGNCGKNRSARAAGLA